MVFLNDNYPFFLSCKFVVANNDLVLNVSLFGGCMINADAVNQREKKWSYLVWWCYILICLCNQMDDDILLIEKIVWSSSLNDKIDWSRLLVLFLWTKRIFFDCHHHWSVVYYWFRFDWQLMVRICLLNIDFWNADSFMIRMALFIFVIQLSFVHISSMHWTFRFPIHLHWFWFSISGCSDVEQRCWIIPKNGMNVCLQ